MNPVPDSLAGLRDIHLPDPVSFWPLAPGWWLLLGLALLAIPGVWLWRRARRRSLRRAALAELDALAMAYSVEPDAAALARGLSALVRRLALRCFGAPRVASLRGEAWNRFLTESGGVPVLTPALADSLALALYCRPGAERTDEAPAWIAAVGGWIRENT